MRKAAIFFARFLAIASGLFVAWEFLGQLYLSSLVIVFNALSGPAAKFAVHHSGHRLCRLRPRSTDPRPQRQ
jgi:hypothetical protein